jgi:S-DNA-T family DNA segregation ATPase FtsK/SpoIIIE
MVAVGGDELMALGPDLDAGVGTFVSAGPPKSGRSNALAVAAHSLIAQGAPVVALAPRPSALRQIEGQPGVRAVFTVANVAAADLAAALPPGLRRAVLLIDDAELFRSAEAKDWFADFAKCCGDRAQGLILAGMTGEVCSGLTGWQVDVKRSRRGLLLSPSEPMQGDLFGLRLPKSAIAERVLPGRGVLSLGDGSLTPVQVPLAG